MPNTLPNLELPLLGSNQDSSDPESRENRDFIAETGLETRPKPPEARPKHREITRRITRTHPGELSPERDAVCEALDRAFAELAVGQSLTAESLRDRLSFPIREQLAVPSRKNLMGAWFRALVKRGKVQHDGWTEAQRDDARHRALRRWRKVA